MRHATDDISVGATYENNQQCVEKNETPTKRLTSTGMSAYKYLKRFNKKMAMKSKVQDCIQRSI